jgi:hypothetical protein
MLWSIGGAKQEIHVEEGMDDYNMTLTENHVTECFVEECVVHSVQRLRAWWIMSIFEVSIVLPLAFLTLLAASSFYLCKSKQMCDKSGESSSDDDIDDGGKLWPQDPTTDSFILRLPYDSSWYFIFGPRFVSGFSSIAILTFCSVRTTWTYVFRGIGEFHMRYFCTSTLPCICMKRCAKFDELLVPHDVKKAPHTHYWWMKHVAIFILCICLALCALQSFLIKLTHMHFVGSTDVRDWTESHWWLFIGFTNQLVGALEFLDVEMARVMLFAFGGADGRLAEREMARCIMYFRSIGRQLVMEIGDDTSPLDVVAELAYINVDRLQGLIMSDYRDKCIDKFTDQRMRFLSDLNTSEDAEDFFKRLQAVKKKHETGDLEEAAEAENLLKDAKQTRYDTLRNLRTKQFENAGIYDVRMAVGPDKEFASLNEDEYESLTEKLRLALETQVKIEELCALDLSESTPGVPGTSSERDSQDGDYEKLMGDVELTDF